LKKKKKNKSKQNNWTRRKKKASGRVLLIEHRNCLEAVNDSGNNISDSLSLSHW